MLEWRAVAAPNPGAGPVLLNSLAVAGSTVWAVGHASDSGSSTSLIERWDGQGWSVVPHPTAGTGFNTLSDIAAVAPDDVWAVGWYPRAGGQNGTLTQHWDGSAWSIVPSPSSPDADYLSGVAAAATNDVWAVGRSGTNSLALHWDGQTWSQVPLPQVGLGNNALWGVAAVAPDDVWAVGQAFTGPWLQPLALHWDGQVWSVVPTPSGLSGNYLLRGVTAVAPDDVWAVGSGEGATLTMRWNGAAWSIIPSPNGGSADNGLTRLAATPGGDLWAVGYARDDQSLHRALLLHWSGTAWSLVPNPPLYPGSSLLFGVVARTATDIWASGSAAQPLILHYAPWPCDTPTPGPSSTPTATGTAMTPTPSPTLSSTPCAVTFADVPPTHPFYAYVRCLTCRGIVSGYADGTFRPYADVTRGQLAKILAGAAQFADPVPSTQQTFADVPPTHPFWLPAERLTVRQAISGYTCGGPGEPCDPLNRPYFRPGVGATRGQIAKITALAAQIADPIPTMRQTFTDVPPNNPFWWWIEQLAGRQIISGYGCGGPGEPCDPANRPYFRWGAPTTRGQLAKIAATTFYPNCQTPARR